MLDRFLGRKGAKPVEGREEKGKKLATTEEPGLGLKVLYQPAKDINTIVDIVLVHGLTGSSSTTWLDRNTRLHWPTAFLSHDIGDARILAFGYDADVVNFWNPASQNTISNHAENMLGTLARLREQTNSEDRKILFIAHSLGGLVTEKALCLSRSNAEKHIQQVGHCATAIAFLGTPHFGADLASWATFGTNIANIVKRTNKDIVSVLRPGSEMLADVQDGFHNMLRLRKEEGAEINITCFYEELALPGVGEVHIPYDVFSLLYYIDALKVVPKRSAILHGYGKYGIHANHMNMTKFPNSGANGYQGILGEIRRWVKPLRLAAQATEVQVEPTLSADETKCLQCLYKSDYESHRKRNPDRVKGTCEWFLQHEKYHGWRQEQKSSLLWVSAGPGCGKSVLASFLVDELNSCESQSVLRSTVCFFFCKDDNDEQKSATFALRALLHQLFTAKNSLVKHAMTEFQTKSEKFTEEFGTLWKIFTTAVRDPGCGNVICVIDGLDECEELTRVQLIKSLVEFYSQPNEIKPFLKFIVTSRPYLQIETEFDDLRTIRLRAEDETDATSGDIELVVKARVEALGRKRNLSFKVQSALMERLISNADRTFLWVSLILADLEKSPRVSKGALDDLVGTIPSTLDAVYEKILGQSSDREYARKLLQIVVAAVRPLTLEEMNVAFAIKPSDRSNADLDLEPSIEDTVKDLCGLFVKVIDSKIYLVHQTAKEFLSNDAMAAVTNQGTWKHSLHPVEANLALAKICISYLMFAVFQSHPLVLERDDRVKLWEIKRQVDRYTNKHDFLDYAATHWAVHFQRAKIREDRAVLESALHIYDTQSNRFLTWFQVYWTTISSTACPRNCTNLMVGSYFGHEAVVKLLLEKGAEPDSKDSEGQTPLSYAAERGHEAVVMLLLEKEADVHAVNSYGWTPLHRATLSGHFEVMKLLLEKGAHVNAADALGHTPLHWTSERGDVEEIRRIEVVQLLLENGADVNAADVYEQTPLHLASGSGHVEGVTLLLKNRADVNAADGEGRTSLHLASMNEHVEVVKLLLENGADVIAADGEGRTPLHWASGCGHVKLVRPIDVVKLLLDYRADVNAADGDGHTPLHWASVNEHVEVVKLLLENGADMNAADRHGRTPLDVEQQLIVRSHTAELQSASTQEGRQEGCQGSNSS